MAYDAARGPLVLFGGEGARAHLGDTWLWDGSVWRRVEPWPAPSARSGYHARREAVVLFGGEGRGMFPPRETWFWDGHGWGELITAVTPIGRCNAAMVYDRHRGRPVMCSGSIMTRGAGFKAFSDTWELD